MCEINRRKDFFDVTVTAWIPAPLCTALDRFARRLEMTRREALEVVMCDALANPVYLRGLRRDLENKSGGS